LSVTRLPESIEEVKEIADSLGTGISDPWRREAGSNPTPET
jgi:hypothetical protein